MDDNNNYGSGNGQNNENQNQYQQQNQMNNQQQPHDYQYSNQQSQDYQYNNQQSQNYQYQQDYQQNNQQQYRYNGQPLYQQQYYNQQPNGNNGMAIGALICGIVSILINCCSAWFISLPTAIAGIILGIMVLKNNKAGRNIAIVGLILSAIGALIGIIVFIGCAYMISNRGMFNDFYRQFQWEFENYY